MEERDILISIIVPVYKVENELSRCVDSIIRQTYSNIEIILVDDGSPDKCPQICDEYSKKDKRIKVIHKKNGGLSDARNVGLLDSTGDYILFIDSDDYIELDSCERFIKILDNRSPDIVIGEAKEVYAYKTMDIKHSNLKNGQEYTAKEYLKFAINALEWYAPTWINMYKRSFLINKNLRFLKGILHEDMQILPDLFLEADKIIYMNYSFYNYIKRENSITTMNKKDKNWESLLIIYGQWKEKFDKVNDLELRELLYGILIKQFLYGCRECQVIKTEFPKGIDLRFLNRYPLNFKERLKVILYTIAPNFYIRLNKDNIKRK